MSQAAPPRLRPLHLGGTVCAVAFSALVAGAAAAEPHDWVIVASTSDAAMGIDRNDMRRDGDLATAAVLMGTFKAENFADGSVVRYYLSRETFDCKRKTRTELSVTMFDPSADPILPDPRLNQDYPVRSGSIYEDILVAACDGKTGLDGQGFTRPIDAIDAERDKRHSASLPVND